MRISELASLTGTTPRTVRFYHQLGLLPEPAREGDGWRDYDMGHVVRLSRVRWLAEAGLPLDKIAGLLEDSADRGQAAEHDLQASLQVIDTRLDQLREQRARLAALLDRLPRTTPGGRLSPLPPAIASFYELVEAQAADARSKRAARRERDFLEIVWLRGDLPPEAEVLFENLGDEEIAASAASFGEPDADHLTPEQVEVRAETVVRRMLDRAGDRAGELAAAIDPDLIRRAYTLYSRVGSAGEATLAAAVLHRLLEAIEEARR